MISFEKAASDVHSGERLASELTAGNNVLSNQMSTRCHCNTRLPGPHDIH